MTWLSLRSKWAAGESQSIYGTGHYNHSFTFGSKHPALSDFCDVKLTFEEKLTREVAAKNSEKGFLSRELHLTN
jgi:hypothetical protein